jgi:glycosyltransferase involved in cell wall biosynthesis
MKQKPELIAFSHYKVGGVQNFYQNILSNDAKDSFDIRWIFYENDNGDPKPLERFGVGEEIIIKLPLTEHETIYSYARRLSKLISKREGVLLTNFPEELTTLHLYRRSKKTIFFTCHDVNYLPFACNFSFLIDVFIAHNEFFYEELIRLLPEKKEKIFFLPYGVKIPDKLREPNISSPLKIIIAARLQVSKGVLDIPEIDNILKDMGISVEWTIVGDGLLKNQLAELMIPRGNSNFFTPAGNDEVRSLMSENDVFILPSRLDGLPVAMLEAMSVGCVPIVSEFNEGIKKVVTQDLGYVLPIGDNVAFANSIADLHKNREMLEKKSKLSRTKVMEEYDIKKRAKDYFDLYRNYKNLKGPVVRRRSIYGGYADHPAIPFLIRKPLKYIKDRLFKKQYFK